MTDDELESRLRAYRDATEASAPPAQLARRVLTALPQQARARRARRDAAGACLVAACLGLGSGLWATLETRALERQLFLQLNAWAEAP
jgi:hypothetical protein